jgi:hypothetical protein
VVGAFSDRVMLRRAISGLTITSPVPETKIWPGSDPSPQESSAMAKKVKMLVFIKFLCNPFVWISRKFYAPEID